MYNRMLSRLKYSGNKTSVNLKNNSPFFSAQKQVYSTQTLWNSMSESLVTAIRPEFLNQFTRVSENLRKNETKQFFDIMADMNELFYQYENEYNSLVYLHKNLVLMEHSIEPRNRIALIQNDALKKLLDKDNGIDAIKSEFSNLNPAK